MNKQNAGTLTMRPLRERERSRKVKSERAHVKDAQLTVRRTVIPSLGWGVMRSAKLSRANKCEYFHEYPYSNSFYALTLEQ